VMSDSRALTLHHQTILIVMAVMALLCACTSTSTGSVEPHAAGVPDLDRALEPLVAQGAVALLRTDAGTWRGASGDTEFGRPAEPQDRFGIGSTTKALFWSDNAFAMWTRIFRQLSASQGLSLVENARLYAMLYLTASDAQIACFQGKERWGFWRPQTAIQNADADGNPATVADKDWRPLLANPPYPDHPSGHNCVSSSIVETLRDFFGTNRMSFTATHSTLGITRSFTRFS
jgi:hypothetical protein